MEERNYRIVKLIQYFLLGNISAEERMELDAWRDEAEAHELFFHRVCQGEKLRSRQKMFKEINALDAYKYFQRKTRGRWVNAALRYTAIVCLPLLVATIWLLVDDEEEKSGVGIAQTRLGDDREIRDNVILVLSDGKKVGVTTIGQDSMRVGAVTVVGQEEKLVYDSDLERVDSIRVEEPEINKIITTTGGFYSLVLSDGTRVWLNSESELEYPVFFEKGQRLVKLRGEAFFEVSEDVSRPFVVETNEVYTRVLGTSFNIKAYENEAMVATTLFTGKVEVSSVIDTLRKVVLSPGKQADWNLQTRSFVVAEVNLTNVIAWKEGMFVFDTENIEVVTRQIERWYGVKFIYDTNNLKEHVFNGYLSKDESLETILNALTFTGGPKFEINGNVVHVKE